MKQNQEVVLKAMEYIKSNLDQKLSMPGIAKNLGISGRHLLRAFRKVLNQTVVESIAAERINNAKDLLQKTQLSITAIAFESGFGNYAHFVKTFKDNAGLSPREFRKKIAGLGESPLADLDSRRYERKEKWFKDTFETNSLCGNWKPISGEWTVADGNLRGMGADIRISFDKPLPENCRISWEVLLEPCNDLPMPSFVVRLLDETKARDYCAVSVASGKRATGELQHSRAWSTWNPNARIKENEWHQLSLEINDDILRFLIDGNEVFAFRDSFPPAYSSRCYLHFQGWHSNVRMRQFAIANLGFLPVNRPIRQGDALFNSGLAAKAMEFYLRYLESGYAGDAEVMELRYKIGMCCLRRSAFSQSRSWIDKVVALREEPFWAQQARLALLELHWRMADFTGLQEHMRLCFQDSGTCNGARMVAQLAASDLCSRGFFEEAVRILQTWTSLEQQPDSRRTAQVFLADYLAMDRRPGEAEKLLLELIGATSFDEFSLFSRINLMQLYHEWGRIKDSENLRCELVGMTKDPVLLVRCSIQNALNFRALERPEEALAVLEEIPDRFGIVEPAFQSHARIHSALILCCLGKPEEGRKALEEACVVDPNRYLNSAHYLPIQIAEGNYASAAESLLKDYRNAKELISSSAELGVKAGILHELAGKKDEAKPIFKEVSQRFPNEQVRYFGLLAGALLSNDGFDFTQMPYEHFRRSEMFYLIGLLKENRGDKASARALFELGVKDDPALRWPAFFAKQLLRETK